MIHPLRVRIGLVRSYVLLSRGFDFRRLGQAGISASALLVAEVRTVVRFADTSRTPEA